MKSEYHYFCLFEQYQVETDGKSYLLKGNSELPLPGVFPRIAYHRDLK